MPRTSRTPEELNILTYLTCPVMQVSLIHLSSSLSSIFPSLSSPSPSCWLCKACLISPISLSRHALQRVPVIPYRSHCRLGDLPHSVHAASVGVTCTCNVSSSSPVSTREAMSTSPHIDS